MVPLSSMQALKQDAAWVQVDTCLAKHATDNVTAIVVCFSADPPPLRSYARNSLRGPSRSLSRDGLSTLSSALASASSHPICPSFS